MSDHNTYLAFVYGGESSEHDVSVKTFAYFLERIRTVGLASHLTPELVVYITRQGEAVVSPFSASQEAESYAEQGEKMSLLSAFQRIKDQELFVCALMYGQNGEDGRLQGAMEFFSIPSNTGTVLPGSLCMSKYHLNQYLQGNFSSISIPQTVAVRSRENLHDQLKKFVGMEIVVKPNSLGSSVITEKMVYEGEAIEQAHKLIRNILEYDSSALVQEYVFGTEYTVACLEKDDEVMVLPAIRIETESHFFGSKEKYITGFSEEIIVPEDEDTTLLKKAKQAAREIFIDIGAQNAVRFDFIITDSQVYFLEANPYPGVTRGSLLPKMLRTRGWDVENLVEIYVQNALSRGKAKTEFVVELS